MTGLLTGFNFHFNLTHLCYACTHKASPNDSNSAMNIVIILLTKINIIISIIIINTMMKDTENNEVPWNGLVALILEWILINFGTTVIFQNVNYLPPLKKNKFFVSIKGGRQLKLLLQKKTLPPHKVPWPLCTVEAVTILYAICWSLKQFSKDCWKTNTKVNCSNQSEQGQISQ